MKRASFLSLFLIGFTIGCFGQTNEQIFYSSFSPQDGDLYLSTDSGKHFNTFTNLPARDYDAAIRPDGEWAVFTSERSGTSLLDE